MCLHEQNSVIRPVYSVLGDWTRQVIAGLICLALYVEVFLYFKQGRCLM